MTAPKSTAAATTELLLLPNGQVLVHNLTPTLAALLAELNPADPWMRERAGASAAASNAVELPNNRDEAIG